VSDCTRPPPGWRCTRGAHAEGPCAAVRSLLHWTEETYQRAVDAVFTSPGFDGDGQGDAHQAGLLAVAEEAGSRARQEAHELQAERSRTS
jgi:hypothetical protein